MELDRFEYEMLDAVLEAFGQHDTLTREQILDIFDHDEDYAASLIGFLESNGLVTVVGNRLPLIVNKGPRATTFLESGGFVNGNEPPIEKEEPLAEPEQFRDLNKPSLNEKPGYENTLKEYDKRIRALELKIKYFENLKYWLWAAGAAVVMLGVWIIKLLQYHRHA